MSFHDIISPLRNDNLRLGGRGQKETRRKLKICSACWYAMIAVGSMEFSFYFQFTLHLI